MTFSCLNKEFLIKGILIIGNLLPIKLDNLNVTHVNMICSLVMEVCPSKMDIKHVLIPNLIIGIIV